MKFFGILISCLVGVRVFAEAPLPGPVEEVRPQLEQPKEESSEPEAEVSSEESSTPTGPVRHAITTAITVPQPLSIGYELIYPELPDFHFFAEGGYFYLPLSGRLKGASGWSVQAGTRFFPFENWFYLGGALGFRQIGVTTDISNLQVGGVPLANTASLKLNSFILALSAGGQWFLSPKVAISFDLGIQLPIPLLHWGKTSIVQDNPDGTDLTVDDSDALSRVTNIPVPQIALVRFIWYLD